MSLRIRGTLVAPGSGLLDNCLLTIGDDGVIAEIASGAHGAVDCDFSAAGLWIVPGFIDLHVHGGGGADFMDGTTDAVRQVARTHARHGTTTLLATTLTAERDQIDRCIAAVRDVMDSPGPDEARIVGIHLEGPYLCAAKRGAQPLAPIRQPNWDEMEQWIRASRGAVKVITLAPEVEGALEFIRRATDSGVIVSIGHTDATYEQACAAMDAGARQGTHLFNAMPSLGHRAPGAVGALLNAPGTRVELIADGIHVHPSVLKIAVRARGEEAVMLITDAISGTAMPDGEYHLGSSAVIVKEGTASYADGTLAGSVLTMNRAFHNIQRFAGVSPAAAVAMASENAARQIQIDDSTGSLTAGRSADLAVIDSTRGCIEATMRKGQWLWRR